MLVTFLRPDPLHSGVVAAVARFDQNLTRARLIAGTRDPVGRPRPEGAQVPRALRPALVATFNSAFRLADCAGGFYAGGRSMAVLRDGAASMVIDDSGRISVAQWGRDRRLDPDLVAVRQNLALIVDNGAPVPGLVDNHDNRWGTARNQLQYTWRSAIGVDAAGVLYYVAGDDLRLDTLARALADTGAVRGMELDIHGADVRLIGYRHETGADPEPTSCWPACTAAHTATCIPTNATSSPSPGADRTVAGSRLRAGPPPPATRRYLLVSATATGVGFCPDRAIF